MIRIGFKTRKKTLSLYERKDRELICMLDEKNGKMIFFRGMGFGVAFTRTCCFQKPRGVIV